MIYTKNCKLLFVVLIYSVIVKIIGQDIQTGWASLMVAITFFSGVQLLGLGIVGQYITRIYDESKNRPIYVVKETVNIEEDIAVYNNGKINRS